MNLNPGHEYLLWIALAAYAAHIVEEFLNDWRSWAENLSGVSLTWSAFYVVNAAVLVLGIACAQVGWRLPEFSLIYPALMAINGLFFHLLPTLVKRRFSPGTLTSLLLFFPVCAWIYWGAHQDGVLSTRALALSTLGAALVMAFPVALAKTKSL